VVWLQFAYPLFLNSTTVHREAWICFFITASFAELIRWFCRQDARYAIASLVLALPAMSLHAGTIGYAAGVAVVLALYSPRECSFKFTTRSVLVASAVIAVVLLLYFGAFNVFFRKLSGRTFESMVNMAETAEGGSYYRIGGNVSSSLQAILYTPLRLLYFYGSPMPWDWRGISDAVAFFVTGLPCLLVLWLGLRESRMAAGNAYRNLVVASVTVLLAFGVVFGWGVRNAGTAMRHRNKVIAVEAAVLAMSVSGSRETERQRSGRSIRRYGLA